MQTTLTPDRKVTILRSTSLFAGLTETELLRLAGLGRLLHLEPKEALFFRGDPGDCLYIVVEGVVRIGSVSAEGHEVTLNLMTAGQMFGEIAMLDGSERTADASALDRVALLALHRRHLLEFLARSPEACMRLLGTLCDRLRWISGLLEDAHFLDIPARLAKRVVMLGFLFGTTDAQARTHVSLRLSQQDLASHIGATRESVNKLLRKWQDEGIITYEHGHLVIIDKQRLTDLFEPVSA
jgi:CRP-like cAMP-binding protein